MERSDRLVTLGEHVMQTTRHVKQSRVLGELIDATPWIDTHEHLVEERHRWMSSDELASESVSSPVSIPDDWCALFIDYANHDLMSAGLKPETGQVLCAPNIESAEKWHLLSPYIQLARNTGYLRATDISIERLTGKRLEQSTCDEIDQTLRDLRCPGYYQRVFDASNVERCQVNSMEYIPFCETEQPEILDQDLSILELALGQIEPFEHLREQEVGTLDDYLDLIEWCFHTYGPRAIAVKCQWAYQRPMSLSGRGAGTPAREFARIMRGNASEDDRLRLQDFLFRRCLHHSTDLKLPVKLHLGYLAGIGLKEFVWVPDHVVSVVPIVQAFPNTQFVLMHAAWPNQEQLLAVAKHHPNVTLDLCWSWILAPQSTLDFVKRFLTTVAASKLLCFGGDYAVVENVVGHAELARRGLQRALEELGESGWLDVNDALDLVPLLMRQNAEVLFRRDQGGRPHSEG